MFEICQVSHLRKHTRGQPFHRENAGVLKASAKPKTIKGTSPMVARRFLLETVATSIGLIGSGPQKPFTNSLRE